MDSHFSQTENADYLEFPPPVVPLGPQPSLQYLDLLGRHTREDRTPSVLDASGRLQVTSGRAALTLALQCCDIGAGAKVLLPAYHCEAMVAPVMWRSAEPVFYRVRPDTKIDFDDLERKCGPKSRALLITHYFVFPQDLNRVREFCSAKRLILIEDCAHAFFGTYKGRALGTFGDYAIASSMKFFPVFDGGILLSDAKQMPGVHLKSGGGLFELKAFMAPWEHAAFYHGRSVTGRFLQGLVKFKDGIWWAVKWGARGREDGSWTPQSSEGGYGIDAQWINVSASRVSRLIVARSRYGSIVRARRRNFLKLHQGLKELSGTKALFRTLPEGVCPFVYPLYVVDAPSVFRRLKRNGVPIWRFGEYLHPAIDDQLDPVSVDLSKRLLQFPCHQDLDDDAIGWIVRRVREAVCEQSGGAPTSEKPRS